MARNTRNTVMSDVAAALGRYEHYFRTRHSPGRYRGVALAPKDVTHTEHSLVKNLLPRGLTGKLFENGGEHLQDGRCKWDSEDKSSTHKSVQPPRPECTELSRLVRQSIHRAHARARDQLPRARASSVSHMPGLIAGSPVIARLWI